MGIAGLLPLLRSITDRVHISSYAGQCVAVDTYCWLHRGASSQASAICKNAPNATGYIHFVCHRVQMLLDAGVHPLLVFDGGFLPAKQGQEQTRAERRTRTLNSALQLEAAGNKTAAEKLFRQAIDIDPVMAKSAIDAVRKSFGDRVRIVVAPYEADAQLTWLINSGHVSAVISEDSDLLAFGCERVLFKMDGHGNGDQVCLARLGAAHDINLSGWTLHDFRLMCILSGCDYLPSIEGMGIKTAHRLVLTEKTIDRILRRIRLQGKFHVPKGYAEKVVDAQLTFQHQRVYDIGTRRLTFLHDLPSSKSLADSMEFLGPDLTPELAQGIAEARINPITLQAFDAAPDQEPNPTESPPVKPAAVARGPMDSYVLRSSSASSNPFNVPRPSSGRPTTHEQAENRRKSDSAICGKRSFQSVFVRSDRLTLVRQCGVVPSGPQLESLQQICYRRSTSNPEPDPKKPVDSVSHRRHSLCIPTGQTRGDIAGEQSEERRRDEYQTEKRTLLPLNGPCGVGPISEQVAPTRRSPSVGSTSKGRFDVELESAGRSRGDDGQGRGHDENFAPEELVPNDMSISAVIKADCPLQINLSSFDFYRYAAIGNQIDTILDRYDSIK